MVGIFSRFAAGRTAAHRRTKSATETRETVQSTSMVTRDESSTSTCKDNDNARVLEFKPIEHPLEPSNHDRPIRCPLPDPSLLNDVIVGKERTSSSSIEGTTSARARADDGTVPNSISEPEHHLLSTALEDSDAAHG